MAKSQALLAKPFQARTHSKVQVPRFPIQAKLPSHPPAQFRAGEPPKDQHPKASQTPAAPTHAAVSPEPLPQLGFIKNTRLCAPVRNIRGL